MLDMEQKLIVLREYLEGVALAQRCRELYYLQRKVISPLTDTEYDVLERRIVALELVYPWMLVIDSPTQYVGHKQFYAPAGKFKRGHRWGIEFCIKGLCEPGVWRCATKLKMLDDAAAYQAERPTPWCDYGLWFE